VKTGSMVTGAVILCVGLFIGYLLDLSASGGPETPSLENTGKAIGLILGVPIILGLFMVFTGLPHAVAREARKTLDCWRDPAGNPAFGERDRR
jgi:hypothetical protein